MRRALHLPHPPRYAVAAGLLALAHTALGAPATTASGMPTAVLGIPTTGPDSAETRGFDAVIARHMQQQHLVGGAVAVMLQGRLVYAKGYGYADQEARTPVTPTSLFRIASVSKPITAVAILHLLESAPPGLTLATPVYAYLGISPFLGPGRTLDPRVHQITLNHLLHHTGGMDRATFGDLMFMYRQCAKDVGVPVPPTHAQFISWAMGQPLQHDPGTVHAYSNYGYCLLGRVIEKATGLTYENYVRQHILSPAGVTAMRIGQGHRTDRCPSEVVYYSATGAKAPSWDDTFPEPVEDQAYAFNAPRFMDAHGGWIASPIDLVRFAARFDQLLTPPSYTTLIANSGVPVTQPENPVWYGAGWQVRRLGAKGAVNLWHSGSMPGTTSLLVRLARGYTWAIVFNRDNAGDLDGLMYRAVATVKAWPATDLEPRDKADGTLKP